MTDIKGREDIIKLVDAFYQKVLKDDLIGSIFTDTIDFIWNEHIPIMYDFWESVLFHKAIYKGNPMLKHIELNKKVKLRERHFQRWLSVWKITVDELFKGEIADKAIEKSIMMKNLMQYKIEQSSNENFIQ